MADKLRMDQVFFNILSNAVKFTPEGGKISYYTTNSIIDDKLISTDFIVEDNGIGMSQEFLEHVFQSFEQEDNQYSANLKGSGLGLSIAKSLVELMGGSITIESQKNIGTKVTVHLMFTRSNIEKSEKKKDSSHEVYAKTSWEGKHILLVEDHPLNVEIATRLLEKVGFVVTQALNGQIAVNDFNASKESFYSAILMDIRMPVMDGIEATKTIRALKRLDAGSVPIIAMSANAYEEDVQKSISVGMNEHLAKPINPALLYQTLERYI
ncbi:response regulator [Anaerosporobacter faecicola]|uniref:response regulator n=1 Tax=Anaerosporobacter faecicola TaxID=2718714 RepID=UPI001439DE22|nr:ATP-binding protein [Anaerosporobacter faecicola]